MKIKLDESLPQRLSEKLRPLGHDVHSAADEGLTSRPDEEIAAASARESRMIFTLDNDFCDIRRFPLGSHQGIVVFRPKSFALREIDRFVEAFVLSTDLEAIAGCLVVVDSQGSSEKAAAPINTARMNAEMK